MKAVSSVLIVGGIALLVYRVLHGGNVVLLILGVLAIVCGIGITFASRRED